MTSSFAPAPVRNLLVGSYTPPMGQARGVSLLVHDRGARTLTDLGPYALTESPSFLARAGTAVLATNEATAGRLTAFDWNAAGDPEQARLRQRGVQSTGGAHPCQLAVHPSGRLVAVANYTGGSVSLHRLADGAVEPALSVLRLHGSGPVADRQETAHAHQAVFADGLLLVADLGSDRIWRYRVPEAGVLDGAPEQLPAVELPPGFGPRQLLAVGGALWVLGELGNQLARVDGGQVTAVLTPAIEELPAGNQAAALEPGPRPELVYVSHRGANRIVLLRLASDGAVPIAEFDCGGDWPRQLSYSDGYLYVANQYSHTVACFEIDPDTGRPLGAPVLAGTPSPSCVLPM